MADYFQVKDGAIVSGPISRSNIRHKRMSVGDATTDDELKTIGFLPQVKVGHDLPISDTQIKEGPINAVNGDAVTSTWTVRDKNKNEIEAEARRADKRSVRELSDAHAEISIGLIDLLLDKGVITKSEIPPRLRKKYTDFKTIVDRLK